MPGGQYGQLLRAGMGPSPGSDPASVAYKAVEEAINNNFQQVLIDTAGRLQNKKNLMEEYKKIANVTKKIDPRLNLFKFLK